MKNFLNKCFYYKSISFALFLACIHFTCVILQQNNLLDLTDHELSGFIQYSRLACIMLLTYGISQLPLQQFEKPVQENKILKEFKEIK